MNLTIRTYSELQHYDTLEERFDYLALGGSVGEMTFGSERWINQRFYHSSEWHDVRSYVISRDLGFDLGAMDWPIRGKVLVHHMNPITLEDIEEGTKNLLDPEFLVSVSHRLHNAIHYGDRSQVPTVWTPRTPGDTALWRT